MVAKRNEDVRLTYAIIRSLFTVMRTQEIRQIFDDEGRSTGRAPLLLTSAVAAGKSKIDGGYDVPQFCR